MMRPWHRTRHRTRGAVSAWVYAGGSGGGSWKIWNFDSVNAGWHWETYGDEPDEPPLYLYEGSNGIHVQWRGVSGTEASRFEVFVFEKL